jgi:hypothetical protein
VSWTTTLTSQASGDLVTTQTSPDLLWIDRRCPSYNCALATGSSKNPNAAVSEWNTLYECASSPLYEVPPLAPTRTSATDRSLLCLLTSCSDLNSAVFWILLKWALKSFDVDCVNSSQWEHLRKRATMALRLYVILYLYSVYLPD